MAVGMGHKPVTEFSDWYERYEINESTGAVRHFSVGKCGAELWHRFDRYKREMDIRVQNYDKLEMLADGEVVSPKPDLPNISSGETAGIVRRVARSLVQNAPNVEVVSAFDDDSVEGVMSRYVLTSKIIGSDLYSNDMQQNLFASTKTAFTLGFDTVIPVLLEDASKSWYMKYDAIHYRDVFPEPGAKDVRDATSVFIRRYLTKGEVMALISDEAIGWDIAALKLLMESNPPARERQSVDHQTKKRGQIPEGYEIITHYASDGQPFLTFSATTKILLRIEKNKHPQKKHPVHFLVLEKDSQQPLGKSQVELIYGRQDFQDLMLNGAMKLWYRNINPSIIGYGTVNTIPNLSPGKYTQISNPNAKIEAFEVNTQTLMQYGLISQQNMGSMVNLVGSPDQQMAQAAGQGMSATPQGVDAQATVVDITTNNYQKAIEAFFSQYCSYALTIYFQELKAAKTIMPTAETKKKLQQLELDTEIFNDDGSLKLEMEKLAVEYYVRCVPGSLTELEDEKQLRILNELFVPLSQAMPAIAAAQDQAMIQNAVAAMQYIITKQIELSGSGSAQAIKALWSGDNPERVSATDDRIKDLEDTLGSTAKQQEIEAEAQAAAIAQLQQNVSMLVENNQILLDKLGVQSEPSAPASPEAVPAPV